jgi:hypothetical protein
MTREETDAATMALGQGVARLFNESPADLDVCMIIAMHHAVAAAAGVYDTKAQAREGLMALVDRFVFDLPDNFADLDKTIQ